MKNNTLLLVIIIYLLFFRKQVVPSGSEYAAVKKQLDINTADLALLNGRVYTIERQLNSQDFA